MDKSGAGDSMGADNERLQRFRCLPSAQLGDVEQIKAFFSPAMPRPSACLNFGTIVTHCALINCLDLLSYAHSLVMTKGQAFGLRTRSGVLCKAAYIAVSRTFSAQIHQVPAENSVARLCPFPQGLLVLQ